MTFFKKPEYQEKPINDYVVIGYFIDKTIVKDENDNLFFITCPDGLFDIGSVVPEELLLPVSNLKLLQQETIFLLFGDNE